MASANATITVTLDDQTREQLALLRHAIEKLNAASNELPLAATAATASLMLAGSQRTISRRGLFGLGWLRRR